MEFTFLQLGISLTFGPRQGKVDNQLLHGKTIKISGKRWKEGNR
jgi:hypothetical protein